DLRRAGQAPREGFQRHAPARQVESFDGFGFQLPKYRRRYGWNGTAIDERERRRPPVRPLLPFLESLNEELPTKWDNRRKSFVRNDDWLLWDIPPSGKVEEPHK